MILAIFSGCGLLQKLGLQGSDDDELKPVSSIVMNEEDAKKLTDKVPIHLYFANEDNTKLKLEVRYISMAEAKKSVNNLATIIVNELIKGPTNVGLNATIPKGTKPVTKVKIDAASATATVDFSKEFIEKHPGGKTAEQLTIYSIVNSLTELKEVQKVKFTINNKSQKEYKGNFKFDSPFPRAATLISKDVSTPTSGVNVNEKDKSKDTKDTKDTKDSADKKDTKGTLNQGDGKTTDTINESDSDSIDVNGDFME